MSNTREDGSLPASVADIRHEDVYLEDAASDRDEVASSRSSFTLAESENSESGQLNINNVLSKLGLSQPEPAGEMRNAINNVVSNFIEMDNHKLENEQQEAFKQKYQTAIQSTLTANNQYIFVSEYEDIEYLEVLDEGTVLNRLYKRIRLLLKKISLLSLSIISHDAFEFGILLVIILNSVKMALDDPLSNFVSSETKTIENIFIGLYCVEMMLKIFAYGFVFGRGSYLRDAWNIMDFVIVVTSLMPFFINLSFSVNSLRAIRVLRPLKTITKVKVLKMIVRTLFLSFSLVLDSLYILVFVMIIFAIAGTQLFSGVLKNRCLEEATGILSGTFCANNDVCLQRFGVGFSCAKGIASPNFSINNFDTFLWSMLSVFQILTMEGWSTIMIQLEESYSAVCFLYCVAIVFLCEYVLLNITLAILKYKYAQVKDNSAEEEEEEKNEYSPELLKKIGVYRSIAQLKECDFERYTDSNKIFVGANRGYKEERQKEESRLEEKKAQPVVRKYSRFGTSLIRKQRSKAIVDRHKNETFETKWDPKTLKFESIKFGQVQLDERAIRSRRLVKQQLENITDAAFEEVDASEEEDHQQSEEEDYVEDCDQVNNEPGAAQSENVTEVNVFATERMLGYLKPSKRKGEIRDLFEFNELLAEIEKTDAKKPVRQLGPAFSNRNLQRSSYVELPDLDFDEKKKQKFYEHFSNLGRYGVKVKKLPEVQDNGLNNHTQVSDSTAEAKAAKRMSMHNIAQQIQLDIKELELVNELSRKKMKCRLKAIELLEAETKYPAEDILLPRKKNKEVVIEPEQPQLQKPKLVYLMPDEPTTEEAAKQEKTTDDKSFKKKEKPQRNMSRCLFIPEFGGDKLTFARKANRVMNSKKTEEEQELGFDKVYKNRLKMRGVVKNKWEEDQPTEVDLIRQYFNVSDYVRTNKKSKEAIAPVDEEVKPASADKHEAKHEAVPVKPEASVKQTIQARYLAIASEMEASAKPEYAMASSAEDLRNHLSPIETASLYSLNIADEEYEIYIEGVSGVFKVFRNRIGMLLATSFYDNLMLLLVLANTVIMCLNGLVDSNSSAINALNLVFTYAFTIDVTLKLVAYGSDFFDDVMNLFDLFVVVVSLVDASLDGMTLNITALRSIRIFRAFRVLRVTRLVRSLSFMKIIMAVVVSVISEFVYIFMLLSLFVFIYTLLGMQIFGGSLLPFHVVGIRQSFDTFLYSLFSVFQLLTVENWNDLETTIGASNNSNVTILFPISWIFIGNWILMNLLQAILLDGFEENTNQSTREAIQEEQKIDQELKQQAPAQQTQLTASVTQLQPTITMQYTNVRMDTQPEEGLNAKLDQAQQDYSLFLFAKSGYLRTIFNNILKHRIFEYFLMVCIALSSAKLVFDTYIEDPNGDLARYSNTFDTVFNGIFLVECAMNIVAHGFIIGQHSYLSNNWSKLDFFICVTAIIDMSLTNVDLSIMKMLRSLRPLRILTRNVNMRIIIVALAESMAGIANVLIIIIMIFLMFGILAITLLQNKMNYCNMPNNGLLTYNNYGPYNVNQQACQAAGGTWATQFINFDNILQSLLSLYVFSTRENWPYYVYTMIDAETNGPVKDNSYVLYFLFAVVFIFVCSYFFMDLMVGVLFLNFHRAEKRLRPKVLLDCQINWINLQKLLVTTDPCLSIYIRPQQRFSQLFFDLVSHRYYEWFSLACILLNILSMMLAMDDTPDSTVVLLKTINTAFSGVFLLELIFKLIAYGRGYFLVGWNLFDFTVVAASIVDFVLDKVGVGKGNSALSVLPQIARISRVLRVTRILRMFKRFKGLQKLIETFIFMMPALANGLALIALFLFISSVVGSYLLQNIASDGSGFYSSTSNFLNFHRSLQLLFICTTGENWYVYMYESMIPGYVKCATEDSCTSPYNLVFWLFYIFLSQKVFMEMLVLIVLDQFESNYIHENNPLGVFALLEDDFRAVWIDKTQKHKAIKLQSKKLVDLILCLKPPLGIGVEALQSKYEEELRQNHNLKDEEIRTRSYEFYMKLKHTSAKWALKMEDLLNRTYVGYHETFYNCAKYAYMSEFLDRTTPAQLELIQAENAKWDEQLKIIREAQQLNGKDKTEENNPELQEMNPMQTILFSQMIIKAWTKYALIKDGKKSKESEKRISQVSLVKKNRITDDDVDSYLNSCGSIQEEARLEIVDAFKKRRPGMMVTEQSGKPYIPETDAYEDMNIIQSRRNSVKGRLRPSIGRDLHFESSGSAGMRMAKRSVFSVND